MARLRSYIELVKEVKEDGELVTEVYYTPMFIPASITYEALDLAEEAESKEVDEEGKPKEIDSREERKLIDKIIDFLAVRVYDNQFSKQELMDGVHGPEMMGVVREQLQFVAAGYQSDETKKFLDSNKRKSTKKS